MAFNPFEVFSVRSKVGKSVMAVLGIVVMLTFVLSSGAIGTGNDIFDQAKFLFNSKARGDVVAEANGEKLRANDLQDLAQQRRAAVSYLNQLAAESSNAAARSLDDELKGTRLTAETKRDIERFVSLKVKTLKDPKPEELNGYLRFLFGIFDFRNFSQESSALMSAFSRVRGKPESDDKKAMDKVSFIILTDLALAGNQQYVTLVNLGESDRDLVDFRLLLDKADQLNIRFSRDAIDKMSSDDAGGYTTEADRQRVVRRMAESARFEGFSADWLAKSVGNEYRARSALLAMEGKSLYWAERKSQMARSMPALILGLDPNNLPAPGDVATASALPGAMTPGQFFEYYKDRCSEHNFTMIELPAESFINKVTATPTPKELNDLFNKYRGELPDPSKDRPGFKDPRKLKIEFTALDPASPRFEQALPKVQAASLFLCASSGAIGGEIVSGLAAAAQPALAESLPIKEELSEKLQSNHSRYALHEWFTFMPRDVSIYRPQPLVGLLAGLGGQPSLGGLAAATSSMVRHIETHDLGLRTPFLLQSWLAPFSPTIAGPIGMPAFAYALFPKLPPEGLYLPEIVKENRKRQRQSLFEGDVKQLNAKLQELSKDATPNPLTGAKADKTKVEKAREESKKYVAEWLKARNLTPLGTRTPISEVQVTGDADLKVLNELAKPEPDGTNSLAKAVFSTFNMETGMPASPFRPDWFPTAPIGKDFDKPVHIVWFSEELEARGYNTLANANSLTNGEMGKRVERAWRLEKARALAKAEAEKLAEEVKTIAKGIAANPFGVEKQLKDLAAAGNFRLVNIDRMAVLKFQHEAGGQARQGYETPKLDKTQVLFPTEDFTVQLMSMRKEPLGGVKVLNDAPRSNFFVACETARFEKTIEQFRDVFVKTNAVGPANNPLFNQYALPEERFQAMIAVRERLRAEAKVEEKEAFRKGDKREQE